MEKEVQIFNNSYQQRENFQYPAIKFSFYQLLLRRRILIPAMAINSAKISSRPITKIIMQKIFPKFDKALKLSGSQSPGKFPTVDRHAIDIDTA